MLHRAVIQSVGHGVPAGTLTNADLEKLVETNDEWIVQRTGMRVRHKLAADESASTIAIAASQEALERAQTTPDELDLIICGTVSGDHAFPSTACLVQDALRAGSAGAMDVGAACAGFIYSLSVGASMLEAGHAKTALVIGVDALTKFTDYTDRSTCVLFGDGAGAVVMKAERDTDRGLLKTVLMSDGSGAQHIILEAGGSRHPLADPASESYRKSIYMNGAEVYRFAVKAMGDACEKVLQQAGMTTSDVDLFVPHQANLRIIESAAKRLELPPEKVFVNVERYGNTSAGSIPLGLYEAEKAGKLKKGDVVLTVGFGAGLVWGANVIRW